MSRPVEQRTAGGPVEAPGLLQRMLAALIQQLRVGLPAGRRTAAESAACRDVVGWLEWLADRPEEVQRVLAAGSVPVATPTAPECEHGMRWPHRYLPVPSSSPCPGPLATPAEPSDGMTRDPCYMWPGQHRPHTWSEDDDSPAKFCDGQPEPSVATPAEPPARCGEKRSQSDAGAYWLNAEQYDSVALCCDEPAGHVGDHRCNEGKAGHDICPGHEACAAEPSVGTGTPAEACGCTACTPDGPIDGKCRCDVCVRSAIWHPESTCICQLCTYARSLAGAPAEAVSGGSGRAERQEPAEAEEPTGPAGVIRSLHRFIDVQDAAINETNAENHRLAAEVALLRPVIDELRCTNQCRADELTAALDEVARYRTAIERGVVVIRDIAESWLYDGDTDRAINGGYTALHTAASLLAAALGDGAS